MANEKKKQVSSANVESTNDIEKNNGLLGFLNSNFKDVKAQRAKFCADQVQMQMRNNIETLMSKIISADFSRENVMADLMPTQVGVIKNIDAAEVQKILEKRKGYTEQIRDNVIDLKIAFHEYDELFPNDPISRRDEISALIEKYRDIL